MSGCAEPAVVVSADDEPVISVPSSPREVVEEAALPGKDGLDLIPEKGRETRSVSRQRGQARHRH